MNVARHALRFAGVGLVWLAATPAPAASFARIAPGVISLKGRIELGDCARWRAALGDDVKTVLLDSPGGRNGQGECISRSIAERALRTVVVQRCASICFLLFAAGAERVVCQEGRIGVHRPSDAGTKEESDDPRYLDMILDYARRYHVPEPILAKLATTPSRSIYNLTPDDLASMGVKGCA